ncbi:hypothetical protein [Rhizobium sp. PL01]|uniref:hypothetical protein n=1 Tax=Rhizobium sp. PL01 TaxID=3085631 RepID=UPI002980E559|nr:hypothetical protein [Rhizobium sp. PL01]MDW5314093.1 hypothetical protein [Rhizobium sp. PL01]
MMTDQPKRKRTGEEIVEHLRAKYRVSPEIQRLVEQTRRKHDGELKAFRAVARGIISDAQQRLATARKLDPSAFAQVPDEVLDKLYTATQTAKTLEEIPGTKINFSFSSEVTVNGLRVPDEE